MFKKLVLMLPVFLLVAASAESKSYILCNRTVEITPVNPEIVSDDDPCSGKVLLQGMAYQCGPLNQVDSKRTQYLNEIRKEGKAYCEKYCKKRSTRKIKCEGNFSEPQKCGFTVDTNRAEEFGIEYAQCNPDCGGVAFAYCSIYHSSLLTVNPDLFERQEPNCECRKKK